MNKNDIASLADLRGPSGFENAVAAHLTEAFGPLFTECRIDPLGSFLGFLRCGVPDAPLLMIDAHLDEVGFLVTSVTDGGFLKFAPLGSPDGRTAINAEVVVHGRRDLKGVVCALPPHLQTAAEMEKTPKLTDLAIDVGLSADEARALVAPGDAVTPAAVCTELLGGRIAGRALDDRLCLAAALDALRRVRGLPLDYDIALSASVREEVGCLGAKAAAFSLDPAACVVLDVTFASQPEAAGHQTFALGGGVTLCVGPFTDRALTDRLFRTAEAAGIPCAPEVYGGSTGTDATPVMVTRAGVPAAVISVPVRNMHTPAEVCDPADADAAAALLAAFLRDLKGEDLK